MSDTLKEEYYCPFTERLGLQRAHDKLDSLGHKKSWPSAILIQKELKEILFKLCSSEQRQTRIARTESYWEAVARLQRLEFDSRELQETNRTVSGLDCLGQMERQ